MKLPHPITHEEPLVQFRGIFHKQLSLWQGIALIVSATVGAGVLGIPYAVAKVGMIPGLIYIICLGLLVMGMNLLLGEITVRTKSSLQLAGLSQKYIGNWAKWLMTVIFYVSLFGAQLIYIIGEGETLQALLGGNNLLWSLLFFAIATVIIFIGIKTIKTVELILTIAIFLVVLGILWVSRPHIDWHHFTSLNMAEVLFPYGVILFAFHASSAIPEAHDLLRNRQATFKKAITISGIISIVLYAAFAMAVVGVTGAETSQIATIGLGQKIGPIMAVFGNIFALLAMGTSYLLIALSLRDSLRWDFHMPLFASTLLVSLVPLFLFLMGLRQFIVAMDFVGGVFISVESILIVLMYLGAKKKGDLPNDHFLIRHSFILIAIVLVAFTFGALYSLLKNIV